MKKSKSASIIRRSDSFAQKRPTSGEFIMSAPPTKRSMVYSDDIEDEDPADYYYGTINIILMTQISLLL